MLGTLATTEIARRLLGFRASRREYFEGDRFDDHAWSILLVAYIADADRRAIGLSDVLEEAAVSPAIGLRWIAYLAQCGLLDRSSPEDVVRMTERGRTGMTEYLGETERMLRR